MTVASWHTDLASDTLAYRSDTPTRGNRTRPHGARMPNQKLPWCMADRTSGYKVRNDHCTTRCRTGMARSAQS